jgi:hypothetical protein
VPFAAWLAWAVAVLIGAELVALAEHMCPKEAMVSEMCTANWYGPAFDAIMSFSTAVAAGLILLLCTLIAPASHERVARLTFLIGAIAATFMAVAAHAIMPLVSALVVGALVWRWFDRRPLWPMTL